MFNNRMDRTEEVGTGAPTLPNRLDAARPVHVWLSTLAIVVLLFLAIWIPRTLALDLFVTADESDWLQRSVDFTQALIQRDWAGTFQFVHPAETTLWAGSVGILRTLPAFASLVATAPDQHLPPLEDWLTAGTGMAPLDLLAVTRWWVTLIIALVTTLTYLPLRRLLGDRLAVLALLLIAWSPMMVGFSRQLQPDGFLATFYFLAVVAFLAWLYAGMRTRDLILSGVAMGLAWLTKTPAALLVPAGGIIVAVELWRRVHAADATGSRAMARDPIARRLAGGYVLWGVVATAVFFALFPAMWLDPLGVLGNIYTVMVDYSGGHTNPNFFMGRIVNDPGPLFYPAVYLFRATPAALFGLAFALVASRRRLTPLDDGTVRRTVGGMLIFGAVFVLGMTVIGKKFDRYLLPVFPLLLVIAAAGWYAIAASIRRRATSGDAQKSGRVWLSPRMRAAASVLVPAVAVVMLHGLFAVLHYPYYITYYNPLVGGNQAAARLLFYGWGEGLEQVGAWLNQQPNAKDSRALSWYADGSLSYTFDGHATGVDYGSRINWLDADYLVLYVNQVQRNIPTEVAIDYFVQQKPVFEVKLDGIVMARVYDLHAILDTLEDRAPDPKELPVSVEWSDLEVTHFETLDERPVSSALPVELRFEGKADDTRKVSLRLISENDILIAQLDVPLAEEVDEDLFVPPDAVPGSYELRMMVYDEESLTPLRTVDQESLVVLSTVEIVDN